MACGCNATRRNRRCIAEARKRISLVLNRAGPIKPNGNLWPDMEIYVRYEFVTVPDDASSVTSALTLVRGSVLRTRNRLPRFAGNAPRAGSKINALPTRRMHHRAWPLHEEVYCWVVSACSRNGNIAFAVSAAGVNDKGRSLGRPMWSTLAN